MHSIMTPEPELRFRVRDGDKYYTVIKGKGVPLYTMTYLINRYFHNRLAFVDDVDKAVCEHTPERLNIPDGKVLVQLNGNEFSLINSSEIDGREDNAILAYNENKIHLLYELKTVENASRSLDICAVLDTLRDAHLIPAFVYELAGGDIVELKIWNEQTSPATRVLWHHQFAHDASDIEWLLLLMVTLIFIIIIHSII